MKVENRNPTFYLLLVVTVLVFLSVSCREDDNVPPVITLNGEDSVTLVLNSEYVEEGAKVVDETDGNISNNVYIENNVNTDLLGVYSVTYRAVDDAGNEAVPVQRIVEVINSGDIYTGDYSVSEIRFYPGPDNCTYPAFVWVDSMVNYRLDFRDFACDAGFNVFADVSENTIEMPFQVVQDSIDTITFQGLGSINDSSIFIKYSRMTNSDTTYWDAYFTRQ